MGGAYVRGGASVERRGVDNEACVSGMGGAYARGGAYGKGRAGVEWAGCEWKGRGVDKGWFKYVSRKTLLRNGK